MEQEHFEVNRRSWDERVAIHRRDATGFYKVEAVLSGADKLYPIEAGEIGDIRGLRIAHLQCHFGLDSLCLARRGAQVTGLDFSSEAVAEARRLAKATGLAATFVQGNVYDARALLDGDFDLVYVTWGAINWLPDIRRWGGVVASLLKSGGVLYLAESHPSTLCLDEVDGVIRAAPRYRWRAAPNDPIREEVPTTYNGDPTVLANKETREWIHPLSEILGGLMAAGMRLDWLHEFDALPWPLFPMMVEGEDRLYRMPAGAPELPLAFSLRMTKA
ncbi:MAG: class I SAM-dependent methyltransferase [Parvibaculaceae bacterium]